MSDLKPCPFCGKSDLIIHDIVSEDNGRKYAKAVFCRDCHCTGRHNYRIGWAENENEAREAWNTRALTDREAKLTTAIQKTIDDNLHLADGDNCTLIDLKLVLQELCITP